MIESHVCPVCGHDPSRDIAAWPSLTRLKKGAAVLSLQKLTVRPQAEIEQLEAALAALREENRQLREQLAQPAKPAPDESLWAFDEKGELRIKPGIALPDTIVVPQTAGGREAPDGKWTLRLCKSVRHVVVPEGFRVLPEFGLSDCKKLETLILPSTLERIEDCACMGDAALRSIALPEGLREIGAGAFANCRALEEIVLPDSLERIGMLCFYQCTGLKRVSFPHFWKGRTEEIGAAGLSCPEAGVRYPHLAGDPYTGVHCMVEFREISAD